MARSIHDVVAEALAEVGIPEPPCLARTVLLQDRYFVGHKMQFDGGHAIWLAERNVVEVYDREGHLLKAVALGTDEKRAAA